MPTLEKLSIPLVLDTLEQCYQEANTEIDPLFDVTVGDGIQDEAWLKQNPILPSLHFL